MGTFEVGDRVQVMAGHNLLPPVGSVVTVTDAYERLGREYVSVDGNGGWLPSRFEPANDNDRGAEAKFKVGDRVIATGNLPAGHTGTVAGILGKRYLVDFDTSFYGGHNGLDGELKSGRGWYLDSTDLEPAPRARKCIVARMDGHQPSPSHRPYVHPNREAAQQEAERLARKEAGATFAVFEMVSKSRATVAPAETEEV